MEAGRCREGGFGWSGGPRRRAEEDRHDPVLPPRTAHGPGALSALLSLEGDIEVVAEVARRRGSSPSRAHPPDVALLDIELPGGDGLRPQRAAERMPDVRGSSHTFGRPGYRLRAMETGAIGYVPGGPAETLAAAIRCAMEGSARSTRRSRWTALSEGGTTDRAGARGPAASREMAPPRDSRPGSPLQGTVRIPLDRDPELEAHNRRWPPHADEKGWLDPTGLR